MFEILLALGVYLIAGILDLKYTEFPDWLPYGLVCSVLVLKAINSYLSSDFSALFTSLIFGSVFLLFGLLLFWLKFWGDGDAWLFGSLGFLFPDPFRTLFCFSTVSFVYLLLYSLVLGVKNRKKLKLRQELRKAKAFLLSSFLLLPLSLYLFLLLSNPLVLLIFPLAFFLALYIPYAKQLEERVFRKRIPGSQLTLKHIPLENPWRDLKPEELERLKKKRWVWVKEGVRFTPVFFLTLLLLLI